jgi:hypothetical protein
LNVTAKHHGYLLLDLAQHTDERLRYRTNIFPDEKSVDLFVPTTDGKSNEMIHILHVFKLGCPKLRDAIISKYNRELLNFICECILKVLNWNIKLSVCSKHKLKKDKASLRTLIDKHRHLSAKKCYNSKWWFPSASTNSSVTNSG